MAALLIIDSLIRKVQSSTHIDDSTQSQRSNPRWEFSDPDAIEFDAEYSPSPSPIPSHTLNINNNQRNPPHLNIIHSLPQPIQHQTQSQPQPQPSPKQNDTTPNSSSIPVLKLSTIVFKSPRITALIASFSAQYNGLTPDFIIESPGRVNLIGEHIDYCGYDVLPMAVEKSILFAVKIMDTKQELNIIKLMNTESTFTPISINLSSSTDTTIVLGHENRHWSIYFLAAYKGVIKNYAQHINTKQFKSLRIMVDGDIPKGSGLSSSSAFVCGSAVALLFSNLNATYFESKLSQSAVASFCIECEREVGVMSGGMDQTICMTANKGFAKHISFIPRLRADDVELPSTDRVKWIICNCLLAHKLQDETGTNNYNTRVVECRLSALLLSKLLNIKDWKNIKTFRDIQDTLKITLAELIRRASDLLNDDGYSIDILETLLECKPLEKLMSDLSRAESVLSNLRNLKYILPLKARTVHVYGEANRVLEFREICVNTNVKNGIDERKLGELMNLSHKSCREQYGCSCDELDRLQYNCLKGGALGSRLTGAGWGGCVVSLVENKNVDTFEKHLNDVYYSKINDVPQDAMFTTSPAQGLRVFVL